MTLKTRNTLTRYIFIFSLIAIAASAASFITAIVTKSLLPPVSLRTFDLADFLLTRYDFIAVIISIAMLSLYVPLSLFLLLRVFENTQSVEVIFFCGALIGCLCETTRAIIPLFGIWQSYSTLLFFLSRIVFTGRMMVPLFFFAAATLSDAEQRQNVERNFSIVLALAAVIASAIPMNTAQTTTACMVIEGFAPMPTIIRILLFIIAGAVFYINAKKHDSPELKKLSFYYIFVVAGYLCLTIADNYLFMGLGTIFLYAGTAQFLRNLHRLYMWK